MCDGEAAWYDMRSKVDCSKVGHDDTRNMGVD